MVTSNVYCRHVPKSLDFTYSGCYGPQIGSKPWRQPSYCGWNSAHQYVDASHPWMMWLKCELQATLTTGSYISVLTHILYIPQIQNLLMVTRHGVIRKNH